MKEKIMKALEKVIDPETGIDVVKMGMIKSVEEKAGSVKIKFRPTTPFCPMISYLTEDIKKAAKLKGIKKVEVEVA
jgi:metal-sulfur cluster biosynthetic enzyme